MRWQRRCAPRPPVRGSGSPRGAALRWTPHRYGRHLHCRTARGLTAHRLPGLPHLERLSGPLRKPGDRKPGDRQAPSARRAAARPDRTSRAGRTEEGGARPQRGDAGRGEARRATGVPARDRPRGPCHRLHRLGPLRRLAGTQRPSGHGVRHIDRGHTVLVDSTDDYRRMLRELALSLSLCSGQTCTAPQNILVPSAGIRTDEGHKPIGRFSVDLSRAVKRLLAEPRRAAGILGRDRQRPHPQPRSRTRPDAEWWCMPPCRSHHPDHPAADIRTPLIVRLESHDEQVYAREWAGPVSFVIATESTSHSLDIFRRTVRAPRRPVRHGPFDGPAGAGGRRDRQPWTPGCTCRKTSPRMSSWTSRRSTATSAVRRFPRAPTAPLPTPRSSPAAFA